MIDAKGYSWSNVRGDTVVGMPTTDGMNTMTGNNNNGFCKISKVSK